MKTGQKQPKRPVGAKQTTQAKKAPLTKKDVLAKKAVSPKKAVPLKRAKVVRSKVKAKVKHHAKRALVPNKANGFRPHLIRAHGLVAVLIVALLAQTMYSFMTAGHFQVLGRSSNIAVVDLLADTNKEREAQGLGDVQLNDQLSQAAFLKAQDMFKYDYWAHTSPSGVEPWKWLGDTGYNYSVAGENLAKNYPTADATVEAWMKSPTHRGNILNDKYVDIGFAVVDGTLEGRATTLVVAFYGAPVTYAAVHGIPAPVTTFMTSSRQGSNPLEFFGSALQSLSPVTIAVLALLAVVAIVGVAAHHYRKQLPKNWKKSWRMHQGIYTFIGMLVLGVLIVLATGGGQI